MAHGNRGTTSKAVGPVVRYAILPLVFRHLSSNNGAATRWITDQHIDWSSTPIAVDPVSVR